VFAVGNNRLAALEHLSELYSSTVDAQKRAWIEAEVERIRADYEKFAQAERNA
jgi:predicted aminopeptidase